MPWTVRLQDEDGKPVVPRDAGIDFATIPAEGDFKLLRYVDPYGDTLFNGIQMDDFLTDWDNLRPASTQVEEWKHVRELAMRCKSEPHLYIRFIGD